MGQQPRKPAGTPVGGQFAPTAHDEDDIDLFPVRRNLESGSQEEPGVGAGGCVEDELLCSECGQPCVVDDNGVAYHSCDDSPDGIDYDVDADHVAVPEACS